MKLGDKVTFKKELQKVMDGSNYISQKEIQDSGSESKWLNKFKEIEHQEQMEGIVVGKRRIGFRTLIELVEDYEYLGSIEGGDLAPVGIGEFEAKATETEFRNVYLVATNLRGFHRVLPEDLVKIDEVEESL